MIEGLDHINIRTARLGTMTDWYEKVIHLTSGPRPPFPFPGAWLYAGEHPLVHLVGVERTPQDGNDLRLEHGAFRARGYRQFVNRLDRLGEKYEIARVPDLPVVQVNVWDPDGNHLHIDFDLAETGLK